MAGGGLLSQEVSLQVPSTLTGLTAVFGMGTGVALSLWPREKNPIRFWPLSQNTQTVAMVSRLRVKDTELKKL